jgi:hypothetical protein
VFYPAGDCDGGQLEIQIFQRGDGGGASTWVAHPEHPTIAPGTCQAEESGVLLNEIRVRCVDPAGAQRPSAWIVGADVSGKGEAPSCPAP